MAQETAGTIGIPVLKNEILPYLTDYAKRRERAELYKQKAEAAAAAKAAKEAEYVPEFKSAPGFGYKSLTKQKQDEAMARALAIVKDPNVPRSQARMAVNDENLKIQYYGKQDEQLEKEGINEIANINKNTYYTAPSSSFYEWAEKQPDYQPTTAFRSHILSRPEFIDFGKITEKSKNFGMEDLTIEEGPKTQRIRASRLYNYDFVDNPNDPFGAKVPKIKEVNGAEAQKFIESDPELQGVYTQWVESRAPQIKATNPTMSDDDAKADAIDEFMKKAFPGGEIKYGQTWINSSRGRSGGYNRRPAYTQTQAQPRTHEYMTGEDSYASADVGEPNDVKTEFSSSRDLNAGARIFPFGRDDDFIDNTTIFAEKTNDGAYPTKVGVQYDDATKTRLYFATDDISFRDRAGHNIKIAKGKEIHPTRIREIEELYRGRTTPIKPMEGFEITGRVGNTRIYGFVPMKYADDIVQAIAAEKGKMVSPENKKTGFPK